MLIEFRKLLNKAIKGTEFEGKVYLAGGCVRDELLSRKTSDIDLTVELPEGGIRLAEFLCEKGIATQPVVYKQFGTALVTMGKQKVELIMTRRESYRHRSRKPEVAFGSLHEDVMRRDFTVNSLLMRVSDGEVLDLCGIGMTDIRQKLIRTTSNPDIIFKEDPLRLLRAVRFASVLGFDLEKKTLSAIRKHAPELRNISRERITDEFIRITGSENYIRGIWLLGQTGLRNYVFPGLRISKKLFELDSNLHQRRNSKLINTVLSRQSIRSRLALILWLCRNASDYLTMLKLTKQDRVRISNLMLCCRLIRTSLFKDKWAIDVEYRRVSYLIGDALDEVLVLYPLTGLLIKTDKEIWEKDLQICKKLKETAIYMRKFRFNLTGDDLIREFCIQPGPKLNLLLALARNYWFEQPQFDKDELLCLLQDNVEDLYGKKRDE